MPAITIRLFGPEARAVGRNEIAVDIVDDSPTCQHLRARLAETVPALGPLLNHCRFAVNHEFVEQDHAIQPDDEVALIGMVSGG